MNQTVFIGVDSPPDRDVTLFPMMKEAEKVAETLGFCPELFPVRNEPCNYIFLWLNTQPNTYNRLTICSVMSLVLCEKGLSHT